MKWFKHFSGSGDDQLIMDSVSLFGTDAYYYYFRILEIMSDEFDIKNPGENTFLIKTLRKKLQISIKKMKKIARFFHEKERIFFNINNSGKNPSITFNCPKLKEICDEYTVRQLCKISGQTPDSYRDNVGIRHVHRKQSIDISLSKDTNVSSDKQPPVAILEKKHFLEKIKNGGVIKEIETVCKKIKSMNLKHFNPYEFAQKNCSKVHPQALLHVLEQIKKQGTMIKSPWAYANKVLHIESQNYNERETVQIHKILKQMFDEMFKEYGKSE